MWLSTNISPARFLTLVILLVTGGRVLAVGQFDDPESKEPATRRDVSSAADEESAQAAAVRESRAWHILSQTDADSLLFGLPQRLGRASDPARRDESSWRGVDGGGRLELDIEVEGNAKGDIVLGFFASPRWWLAEPVQVRRYAGPGRYTVDRLPPGEFQIGAMIGELPRPVSLGVHRTWPTPITVATGETSHAELRVSNKFRDHVFGAPGLQEGFAGKWHEMDPAKTIAIQTSDQEAEPVPFCRITLVERQPNDPTKIHFYHELGTDDKGRAYFELSSRFSLSYQRFDFVPETMTSRYQWIREAKGYDSRRGPFFVERTWDEFPVGTGKVRGRVHDQRGRPLTGYFLNMTRREGADLQTNDDAQGYGLKLPVTDSEGRFEVKDLFPGTYTLMVRHFDYPTHVSTFDGPQVTVHDERNAEVEIDVEVEAKELRYARAVFDDGRPVHPGAYTARFTRDPESPSGGALFSDNTRQDGSFRVALSREELRQLTENFAGFVDVYAYDEKHRKIAEVKVPFETLSNDRKQPTKVILLRRDAKTKPGQNPKPDDKSNAN